MNKVTFEKVQIQNFLSVGKEILEINFQRGTTLIVGENKDVGGKNGVGKSTIADAIYWCLFGETLRELKKSGIQHNRSKKDCWVMLFFSVETENGTKFYSIKRDLDPAAILIKEGDKNITPSTIAKSGEMIQELIGANEQVFQNAVIMSANNTLPFMAQKKIDKRKFIEGIFRLNIFGDMLSKVRGDYNETKKENDLLSQNFVNQQKNLEIFEQQKIKAEEVKKQKIKEFEDKITATKASIAELLKQTFRSEEDIKADYADRKKKIATLEEGLQKKAEEYQVIVGEKAEVKAEIGQLQKSKVPGISSNTERSEDEIKADIADRQGKIEALQKNLETKSKEQPEILEEKARLKAEIAQAQRNKAEIVAKGDTCPTCNRKYCEDDGHSLQDKIAEIDAAIKANQEKLAVVEAEEASHNVTYAAIKAEITKLTGERDGFQGQLTNAEIDKKLKAKQDELTVIEAKEAAHNELCTTIRNGIAKLKIQQDGFRDELANKLAHEQKIINLEEKITEYKGYIKGIEDEKHDHDKNIEDTKAEIKKLEDQLSEVKKKLQILGSVKFIVSEEGVKTYIVKKMIASLNQRLNFYLKSMDAPCKCEFDEAFDETIYNDNGTECSYHNFSGGERKRIDVAILFMFQDILRLHSNTAFSLNIYDELFDSALDEKGVLKILEILKAKVEKYNEAVYIVSHKSTSNFAVDNILKLEKHNGTTKIAA